MSALYTCVCVHADELDSRAKTEDSQWSWKGEIFGGVSWRGFVKSDVFFWRPLPLVIGADEMFTEYIAVLLQNENSFEDLVEKLQVFVGETAHPLAQWLVQFMEARRLGSVVTSTRPTSAPPPSAGQAMESG